MLRVVDRQGQPESFPLEDSRTSALSGWLARAGSVDGMPFYEPPHAGERGNAAASVQPGPMPAAEQALWIVPATAPAAGPSAARYRVRINPAPSPNDPIRLGTIASANEQSGAEHLLEAAWHAHHNQRVRSVSSFAVAMAVARDRIHDAWHAKRRLARLPDENFRRWTPSNGETGGATIVHNGTRYVERIIDRTTPEGAQEARKIRADASRAVVRNLRRLAFDAVRAAVSTGVVELAAWSETNPRRSQAASDHHLSGYHESMIMWDMKRQAWDETRSKISESEIHAQDWTDMTASLREQRVATTRALVDGINHPQPPDEAAYAAMQAFMSGNDAADMHEPIVLVEAQERTVNDIVTCINQGQAWGGYFTKARELGLRVGSIQDYIRQIASEAVAAGKSPSSIQTAILGALAHATEHISNA